jgi:glyoxylase-like metal-dependent hydrolase (beta-lactamase superfamily II)
MSARLHRRDLLRAAAGGALGASLPLAACGRPQAAALPVTRINDAMTVVAASGGNVFAARGPDGIVMIDGGFEAEAPAVLSAVRRELGRAPFEALFNTHWHRGQTGANLALGKAGTRIVAHENTKQWLAHEIFVRWENKTYDPLPAEALPTETFYASGSMPFGGSEIAYGHMLQAHTDGDIYVYFPEADVLVTGGAVTNDAWPVMDWWTGGWMGGLLDAFITMLDVAKDSTVIVPGSGPLMTRAELSAQNDMYMQIFDRLSAMLKDAYGPAEVVAARPTQGFKEEWAGADLFAELAFRSFYGHLRGDPRIGAMP